MLFISSSVLRFQSFLKMEMVVYREEADKIQKIRSVLGDLPEQNILRALSLSGNNSDAAINLILDTPGFMSSSPVTVKRTATSTGARVLIKREIDNDDESLDDDPYCRKPEKVQVKEENSDLSLALVPVVKDEPLDFKFDRSQPLNPKKESKNEDLMMDLERKRSSPSGPSPYSRAITPVNAKQGKPENQMTCYVPIDDGEFPEEPDYVLLGRTVVVGLSTCKRRKLDFNEIVYFTFPSPRTKANFVRFWTKRSGEIGRLPIEWTRNILYLVSSSMVKLCGRYVAAPMELHMMQDIHLFISMYVHRSVFTEGNTTTSMSSPPAYSWSAEHPLPSLIRLLEIKPIKQAELNSEELDNRKRSLNLKAGAVFSNAKRAKGNHPANQFTEKNTEEQTITESMLNKLIGAAEVYNLEEKDPPETLTCVLHPYQKQALYWMSGSEEGFDFENAANTLHPCWEVYRLTDRRASEIYINIFSGEATTKFPKATQIARGGILADAMGLGKTVMTIALILARQGKGIPDNHLIIREDPDQLRRKRSSSRAQGGTLIVCPMALLGQWKDELETHSVPGTLQVSVQYGVDRTSDPKAISKHDVVLTTYGVLSQAYKMDREQSIFHQVDWFRVVLDEAHSIKSSKTQVAQASFSLSSYCRWCLTGTPLQNSLEDLYSLLHFLRVEPWCNWAWWQKLIQKPYEAGDERALRLVKAILRPLMLRRTKDTKDKYGRPILVLPAADIRVIKCEQSEVERDFYDALFKRSKIQFEHFVAQGNVLKNYASILELLLRLRQCCNHPFLVMGRADSIKYVDVNELARRFLEPNTNSKPMPTPAFVEEVVEGIRRGETSECPICLESADDPVLTPCAHRMCRECLITSWSTPSSGICPICRQKLNKTDLISCPTGKKVQLDAENNWKESCKVVKLLDCLETLRKSGSGEKSIVFSQWTSFFDLLEIPMRKKEIEFLRFDGKLSQKNRENVLKEFSETNEKMVLLMSLKAGGVGLNLTMASNVFLMDPWWNPAVEEQAIMRIHRIGQKRVVAVRRFIVKDTVEDRMQQVQARKQRMISGALTDDEIRETRMEDLKMLFS